MHGASIAVYGFLRAAMTRSPRPAAGTEIDEQHLILGMVDDPRQIRPTPRQIRRRKLTFEHGVLQMVPVPAHRLKDFAQPLVVADVVADQVRSTHKISLP
jgi:hypothetical protein